MMRLDDETKSLLKSVVDHFNEEDRIVRESQLRHYRRLKLYWNSFSQIYWSESARDYKIYSADDLANSSDDQGYYDRPVNVFRAFLETVIAALSIQVPGIRCVPDDADNPSDLSTAKAGDRIAELLYKRNDVIYAWLHSLYIHYTEGLVAAYTYEKQSEEFGTYNEKNYKDEPQELYVCPHCQAQLDESDLSQQLALPGIDEDPNMMQNDQMMQNDPEQQLEQLALEAELKKQEAITFSENELNEFGPDNDDAALHSEIINKGPVCPECGEALDPELQKTKLIIPRFVGMTAKPKSRICFDIYGGLYIKIANYAKKQEDTPYLIWSYETHYANALEKYQDLRESIPHGGTSNTGVTDPYEQYARLNPQYKNAFPEEQVTIKNAWLRPAAFNVLEEDQAKELKKKFPDGARVVLVNEFCAEAENEALDDCWTLTKNPMHDFVNHDPPGELLVNIQDIVNDLISLSLQTIEHGIAQTWADPAVVNFEAQQQLEAQPGTITPTKSQGGAKGIGDAFYSTKNATLSPEVFQFYSIINQLGQFVSAAMPSIFGGSQEAGSSRTASEYAMSRTASLQRLQTTWRMFTIWWKDIFGKAIPAYMKLIKDDERFVERDDNGNYINIWIRRAEISGKIGSVELESAEQIPISDEQKADIIMKLFELNNQEIIAALAAPENLPFIRKVVKIPEFKLPGEDDRQKQYEEIQELMQSEPVVIPIDPMQIEEAIAQGQDPEQLQPQELPSIEPDLIVDNHAVEAQICRSWLISDAGRLAKQENPPGYKNVLLHMKAHMDILAQQQMQQMQLQQQQQQMQQSNDDNSQSPKPPKGKEIKGANDARTPVE